MERSVIFVFYRFYEGKKIHAWEYKHMPTAWVSKYPGNVYSLGVHSDEYEYEQQFIGSYKLARTMMAYLQQIFEDLHEKGIIEKFQFRYPRGVSGG
jgi:hypothetical protein